MKKLDNKITKLCLKIAQKTKQKNINNAKLKNILEIKKSKKEIKYIKKMFEILFNTIINSLLFAFLFFNILSTLISNFVASKIITIC
jgi:hypothetical protein